MTITYPVDARSPYTWIKPIKLPKKEHLNTNHLFDIKSLKPFNQPEDSSFAFSEIALFDLKVRQFLVKQKLILQLPSNEFHFLNTLQLGFEPLKNY